MLCIKQVNMFLLTLFIQHSSLKVSSPTLLTISVVSRHDNWVLLAELEGVPKWELQVKRGVLQPYEF